MVRNQLRLSAPMVRAENASSEIYVEPADADNETVPRERGDEDRARNRAANLGSLWQRP